MEQMNLKLDNVFTDILVKSGQAIIKAILDGERDPKQLIHDCDQKIQEKADRYTATIDTQRAEILRSEKRDTKKNRIDFDIEQTAHDLWGVNVMRMPGMSRASHLRLIGELGSDFTEKFPDVQHFVSWANLVPNNKISGGVLLSIRVPKKNPVGMIFRQCANTIRASKCPLGDYFRHMRAKGGYLQAMVATGKKLATIFTNH